MCPGLQVLNGNIQELLLNHKDMYWTEAEGEKSKCWILRHLSGEKREQIVKKGLHREKNITAHLSHEQDEQRTSSYATADEGHGKINIGKIADDPKDVEYLRTAYVVRVIRSFTLVRDNRLFVNSASLMQDIPKSYIIQSRFPPSSPQPRCYPL